MILYSLLQELGLEFHYAIVMLMYSLHFKASCVGYCKRGVVLLSVGHKRSMTLFLPGATLYLVLLTDFHSSSFPK
jgi:hypothetical protein